MAETLYENCLVQNRYGREIPIPDWYSIFLSVNSSYLTGPPTYNFYFPKIGTTDMRKLVPCACNVHCPVALDIDLKIRLVISFS